jgi:hypothetical protein
MNRTGIEAGLESQIHALSNGRAFGKCQSCNLNQIIPGKVLCPECERLKAMGYGAPPAKPGGGVADTQNPQSNPSNDHSGYSDTIPSGKFPPKKERV